MRSSSQLPSSALVISSFGVLHWISANSASLLGSRSPARMASMIRMPDFPVMSDRTSVSFMFICCMAFCIRRTMLEASRERVSR